MPDLEPKPTQINIDRIKQNLLTRPDIEEVIKRARVSYQEPIKKEPPQTDVPDPSRRRFIKNTALLALGAAMGFGGGKLTSGHNEDLPPLVYLNLQMSG